MIHLVRIITRLNLGGPARQIEALTPRLMQRGMRTTILCGAPAAREDDLEAEVQRAGAVIEHMQSLRREPSVLDCFAVRRELRAALKRLKPDLVHTHTAKAGWHGRALASAARIPVVHTFHGHLLHGYFGTWKSWVYRHLERRATARSTMSICVSERVRQDLVAAGILNSEQSVVIRPGIELARFEAAATTPLFAAPTARLLFVGRLVDIKRPLAFLELLAYLRRRGLAVRGHLLGDGPLREAVLERIRALQLESCAELLPTSADPALHLGACDVVVNTSRNEGLPLSVLEAQAAGRVVVATDVGGSGEAIRSGVNGILVPPEDLEALGRAVAALIKHPESARQMAAQGRIDALRSFSADRSAAEHAAVYARMLGVSLPC